MNRPLALQSCRVALFSQTGLRGVEGSDSSSQSKTVDVLFIVWSAIYVYFPA